MIYLRRIKVDKSLSIERIEKMKVTKNVVFMSIICILVILSFGQVSNAADTYYQYVKTGIDQFPASYQERLQQLASKYPNWKFQAYYTGISWDKLIQNERDESVHRNRVTNNAPSSWKNSCGYVYDGWACASDAIVAYYLDPRNFLNETQIFQFVESSYNANEQTLSKIQESVKGTFLDATITCNDLNNNPVTMSYAEMIIKAAQESNISAYYIKSKIIQEVGSQGSGSVSGMYPGYEGYYNFYNFGSYDTGDPIANGLLYARDQGWDSPYKAIVAGAQLIGKNYIEAGQNTAYFNKWDVVGTKILRDGESQTVNKSDMFWHQYMTNIQDPTSQSYSNYELYSNSLQSEITFIIPVYNNMPASNPMPQDVPVESISLNKDKFVVNINEKDIATVTFNPSNVTNKNVIWEVSDPEIVRVWNGEFRGLKEGKVTITAKTEDGGKTATCEVFVRDPNKNYVEQIVLPQSQYIINIDDAVDIEYSCLPNNSENTKLVWTTDNPEIIRVWDNRFRGLQEGVAEVIATTDDGTVEARCKVIVRDPNKTYVEQINIEKEKYIIYENEAVDINYTCLPENSENTKLVWTTDNPEIIRVWDNRFRGLKEGTAEVIATTDDGTVEARCKVIVRDPNKSYVEDISFEETSYIADIDEAIDIPFSYTPQNSVNAEFEWTTDNPDIIRVWGNRFRGLKKGTAEVIVRTLDGSIEKRIQVEVKDDKVEKINLEQKQYTVNLNEAVDIPFTYTPSYATNAEFEWTTDNPEIIRVWGNRFRGLKEGTAEVIVRTLDGTVEEKIQVIVRDPSKIYVEDILIDQTEYEVGINEAVDIPFTFTPANADNAEFEWTTENPEIIRVWGNRFRALQEGVAEVIVRTLDGTVEKRIKVIVRDPNKNYVNDILIDQTKYEVEVDEAVDIPFTFTPADAANAEFEWTTENPEIIRVWGNRFRALQKGTAEVIVRTLDGTVEKRLQVTVK